MPKQREIIAMSSPVEIKAAEGEAASGPKSFSSTFYTGGALNVSGWDLPVVVDLAGLKSGKVLVANLDHDSTKRVGNFELVNDGTKLIANGKANAATAARDEVVNSAIDGYQWQASLEVNPGKVEELAKGKTATVNGQEITGPAYITRTGTLKGFGFVSHGADDNTTATIAASADNPKRKGNEMDPKIKAWAVSMGIDVDSASADQIAVIEANYAGQNPAKKTPEISAGFNALKADRERTEEITAYALAKCEQQPQNIDAIKILAEQAIEEKWPTDKFRLHVLEASAGAASTPWTRERSGKIDAKTIEAALCMAGGLQNIDNHFTDQHLQAAHDRFKEGIGLNELLKIVAGSYGYKTDAHRANLEMQKAAFGQLSASGFSTLSLPGILSNTANKFMLEGWGGGEMTWQNVTAIRNVRDFKTATQYRLGGTLKYDKVGPTGEIKHGQVGETSYDVKAETYGKMFAITRTDIINDDLNALSAVPRELGYGANEAFNEVFWTEWLSGVGGFFAYTSAGAMTSAAALATIAAAEAAFFALTKPNGEPLGVMPSVLLVPNGSYRVAQSAMASPIVAGGSTTVPSTNTFQGEYKVVRSAYLSNTAYTNYSTIRFWLCAVRPGFAPIQTAFLNGQQAPMVESAQSEFNTLGIQMRGVHDFGCNLFEARAAVNGAGA